MRHVYLVRTMVDRTAILDEEYKWHVYAVYSSKAKALAAIDDFLDRGGDVGNYVGSGIGLVRYTKLDSGVSLHAYWEKVEVE